MVQIRFEVDGDVQLARSFARFADDVKDLSPAWEEIERDFENVVSAQQFRQGGRGESGGWAPLSPNTLRHKRGPSILVERGSLRGSLAGKNEGSIRDHKPLELRLGTRVPYAIFHQRGTRRMPQRKVIDLNDGDRRRWVKYVQKYLVSRAERAF